MKIDNFEDDPNYKELVEHARIVLSNMTPDERAAKLVKLEETIPTTFEAGSSAELIAKKILQFSKDLDVELAASNGN